MHVEISVALNFLISHLHSKLPRRRAQLFREELERLLRARYEGHWYPERPLRGSAFRCLHIGGVPDPLLEQAARISGLDAAEVRENVPQELRVWIDPFEVSYQIGEKGAVRVLYSEGEEEEEGGGGGEKEAAAQERASQTREPVPASGEEGSRNSGFNPEARAFVPTGAALSGSPGAADVFGGPGNPNASPPPSSSSSSASFPKSAHPQLLTFTTASFAATKFGSTKMKKGGGGGAGGGGVTVNGAPPQRHGLPRSPVDGNVNKVNANNSRSAAATGNPLSLSLCSLVGLGGGGGVSQLSPNAKEFVYPESSTSSSSSSSSADGALFSFGGEVQFQQPQTSFCPLNSAEVSRGFFLEKTRFVDGMGFSLSPHAAPPYPSQPFQQPVVLAN